MSKSDKPIPLNHPNLTLREFTDNPDAGWTREVIEAYVNYQAPDAQPMFGTSLAYRDDALRLLQEFETNGNGRALQAVISSHGTKTAAIMLMGVVGVVARGSRPRSTEALAEIKSGILSEEAREAQLNQSAQTNEGLLRDIRTIAEACSVLRHASAGHPNSGAYREVLDQLRQLQKHPTLKDAEALQIKVKDLLVEAVSYHGSRYLPEAVDGGPTMEASPHLSSILKGIAMRIVRVIQEYNLEDVADTPHEPLGDMPHLPASTADLVGRGREATTRIIAEDFGANVIGRAEQLQALSARLSMEISRQLFALHFAFDTAASHLGDIARQLEEISRSSYNPIVVRSRLVQLANSPELAEQAAKYDLLDERCRKIVKVSLERIAMILAELAHLDAAAQDVAKF